jgi:hypothetical protein
VLVWAFHIDKNLAKSAEALERIEKLLGEKEGKK